MSFLIWVSIDIIENVEYSNSWKPLIGKKSQIYLSSSPKLGIIFQLQVVV